MLSSRKDVMLTSQEINDLARTYEEAILSQKMTKAEIVMLVGLLQARLMKALDAYVVPEEVEDTEPTPSKTLAKATTTVSTPPKRAIKYDTLYDPPPPFSSDPLPPPPEPTGKVIARKNQVCTCVNCNRIAYIVNKDIADNCKVKDFVASFTAADEVEELTPKIEIMNMDGNISVDCPRCQGNKTVYLVGKKAYD